MMIDIDLRPYENIIFDLGGVLIDLDYQRSVDAFLKRVPALDPQTFNGKEAQLGFYSAYEVGKIKSAQLLSEFNTYYHSDLSLNEFAQCWNAMILGLPPEKLKTLQALRSSGRKIYLLSNINELHAKVVDERFAAIDRTRTVQDYFEQVYYSYEIGLRKPDTAIFERVVNDHRLNLKTTVFLDDSAHHIAGAKRYGLQAIHFTPANSSFEKLRS